ncbi:MAG TPA: type II toxin-antitoxin system Phd/YefM family antitoxin [Vicinamibacteria bacterium]|nr:type II toxin-antitoxin system Phd/YefM family antitoxin [Vicinamibacteria bacterium]
MDKIIGVTELQRRFKAVFDEVAKDRIAYILTRGSRPEAVMIPYTQYQKFVRLDESGVLSRFDKLLERMELANARYSDEEVEHDLQEGTREVRARKRRA